VTQRQPSRAYIIRRSNPLDRYGAGDIAAELEALHGFERDLAAINRDQLDVQDRLDHRVVGDNIQARRLELRDIRAWATNPQFYGNVISTGLQFVALYEYEPLAERLGHIIARENEVARLLGEAKANITNPAAILVEVGLATLRGTLSFVESDVPKAFEAVNDRGLQQKFAASTAAAATALRAYIGYLETDLKGRAHGDFAIGKANYEAKLRYLEGIDLPVESLLAIAEREIRANQERFREAARRIDRDRTPSEVWDAIRRDHPPAGQLVPAGQKQLETLIAFIAAKRIVTIPPAAPVLVAPTPEFFRWSFASMWNPGPFETQALRSPYYITDVDPSWTREKVEEHLGEFSRSQLWLTSIHEAYPGHYVQALFLKRAHSKVRKASPFGTATLGEGWAHYCEQMMIDEGFGGDDPRLRMAQVKMALLRLCRHYVGLGLHTRGMTVSEGTRFFMDNAYMDELPARREAERGTFDTYWYVCYSLGKLAILKLREDYRRIQGERFALHEFHDRLLECGGAALWVHRQSLIPGDQGRVLDDRPGADGDGVRRGD
jgi:uncharacterized protein (DUF885 family)